MTRNYHSHCGYFLLLLAVISIIDEAIQQPNFDYNFKNIYGESEKATNNDNDDNNDGNIMMDYGNQNIAPPLQYYEDFDNRNDKVFINN